MQPERKYSVTDAPTYLEWPRTRWRLSAPETYVVLNGAHASGAEAFKLSLTELVARGVLVLEESAELRRGVGTGRVSALRDGARAEAPVERVLAATWDVYAHARRNARVDGAPAVVVADLARAAAKRYGALGHYVAREVVPALEERGLFEARAERVLGVFHTTRHVLTAEGEAARADLDQWLAVGRDHFAGWSGNDTSRALAYTGAAGSVVLLMPALFPHLQRLRAQLPGGDDSDWDASSGTGGSATLVIGGGDLGAGGLNFSGIDSGNLDACGFGGLEAAMSAIDCAVDAGGSTSSDSGSSTSSDSGSSGSSDSGSSSSSSDSGSS